MDKTQLAVRLALLQVQLDVAGRTVIAHRKIVEEMRRRGMPTDVAEIVLCECQTAETLRRQECDRLAAEFRAIAL